MRGDTLPGFSPKGVTDLAYLKREYFLLIDGQSTGPFRAEQVIEMLSAGEIHSDTQCSWEGANEWVLVSKLFPYSLPSGTRMPGDSPPVRPEGTSIGMKVIVAVMVITLIILLGSFLAGHDAELWQSLALILFGIPVYFLPTILAGYKHRNYMAIAALNLLLGWTLIGWVAALVWALYQERSRPYR